MARILLKNAEGNIVQSWNIRPRVTVGRSSKNDVVIPDITVSREHFKVELSTSQTDCVVLTALSDKGLLLNDLILLTGSILLFSETKIKLGSITLILSFDSEVIDDAAGRETIT